MRSFIAFFSFVAALAIAAVVSHVATPLAGFAAGAASFAAASAVLTPQAGAAFANNFGVLVNSLVIHDAFSLFLQNLLPLRDMFIDVQDPKNGGREAKPGETITIKDWRTAGTGYAVGAGGYNTLSDVAPVDTQITLSNTPWAVSIALTAAEYRVLASGLTKGADYDAFRKRVLSTLLNGLGKRFVDQWLAVVTAANFANYTVTAAGTFGRSTEVDLDAKFFGRDVPAETAIAILPASTYGEWVKDQIAVQTNTGENRPKALMGGGVTSPNSNFRLFRTNRPMPAEAPRGFLSSPTGIIGAFRVPDEATFENDPVALETLVEPQTQIPLLSRLWKNSTTGTIQLDLASIHQFAKGQTEAVERLLAVAP